MSGQPSAQARAKWPSFREVQRITSVPLAAPMQLGFSGGKDADALNNNPYVTQYSYDALGNLLSVAQNGDGATPRNRSFTYDGLGRLLSATNSESGTVTYGYDDDSNLITKTSPAPNQTSAATVTTTYTYDALHRVKSKSYSDGTTPTASYSYDETAPIGVTVSNPVGRLTSQSVSSGSTVLAASIFSYDVMGRLTANNQCTPNNCGGAGYPVNYTYNLGGNMTSYTNGMGTTFNQSFDSAGRFTQLTTPMVDAQHPGSLATVDATTGYYPSEAVRKMSLGNGLVETAAYNTRLQPCRLNVNSSGSSLSNCTDPVPIGNVQDFTYGFNLGTTDNGNVTSVKATGAQTFNRSYGYDPLNRLSTMSSPGDPCAGLAWKYDPWGNRTDQTATAGKCVESHVTVLANNRLGAPYTYDASGNVLLGPAYVYDAAGNLTNDGIHRYTYDAENRVVSVDGGNTATYLYDVSGQRVRKTVSGIWTDYVYNGSGNAVAEVMMNGCGAGVPCWSAGYVYVGEKLLAQYKNGATYFVHKDHLGSTGLVTNLDKTLFDSMDYLPYGEQIAGGTGTTHKFTGKERDAESGLDNFGFRYDSSSIGRFMTADPLMASARTSDPQTWNRYTYALNNPLRFVDPNGLKEETGDDCAKDAKCVTVKVHVIYDRNANDGKGVTDKQKEAFGKQLQEAKDEYGDAHIHLDVRYTTGALNDSKNYDKGAENVLVTDTGNAGDSQITSKGYAVSRINVRDANLDTLAHEMAHQFAGDTRGVGNWIMNKDPVGFVAAFLNAVSDITNDVARSGLGSGAPRENTFGMGRDMTPADTMSRHSGFNRGALEFQNLLNQQSAIRPQQK